MLEDYPHAQMDEGAIRAYKHGTLSRTIAFTAPHCSLQRHTVIHTLTHTHTVINRYAPLADLPPYPDVHMELPSTHSQMHIKHREEFLSLTETHKHKYLLGTLTLRNAPPADYHASPLLQEQRKVKMDPL